MTPDELARFVGTEAGDPVYIAVLGEACVAVVSRAIIPHRSSTSPPVATCTAQGSTTASSPAGYGAARCTFVAVPCFASATLIDRLLPAFAPSLRPWQDGGIAFVTGLHPCLWCGSPPFVGEFDIATYKDKPPHDVSSLTPRQAWDRLHTPCTHVLRRSSWGWTSV